MHIIEADKAEFCRVCFVLLAHARAFSDVTGMRTRLATTVTRRTSLGLSFVGNCDFRTHVVVFLIHDGTTGMFCGLAHTLIANLGKCFLSQTG